VVHTSTVACLAGLVGARIAGSASVVHLHDLTLWRPRALGFLYGLVLAISADTIVAVSEAAKRAVLPTRLARKVAVVHNAVDLERFGENPEERERARAALGAKPSEFLVGCVGNLDYRKGQDLLADVAVLLQRFGNEFRFVVIGGVSPSAVATGFAEQFGQQIDGLSVRRHFTFLGQREDVPSLLTACDALIQPSRFDAGPVAVLEAMACRLPVVATNVGGNREEVSDNVTGLIVPSEDPAAMADALHSLWADPLRRNRMGQAGRRQVERTFGCRKQLEHILAIYRTAVQRRPGRVNRPCDQVLPS
jgi:glycosyltransferase involved in cell wall biosynthesis